MANLIIKFYENGYNFEYKGKAYSELQVKQTGYIVTDEDFAGIESDFFAAGQKYGKKWISTFKDGIDLRVTRLKKHNEEMQKKVLAK